MILSKSTLKLLLFSILTLAIISCGGETKAKTTSVKVSIDVPNSISRGVKGTYPDITDIILDISDANGKYYAKGRQFKKVTDGVDFVWTTTVDNVPVNLDLNFTASAYDINETKIFKGLTGKTLTLQSAAVFINLFPISDGNAPSIPEITSVSPVSDGVLLHIKDDVSDKVQYQVSPDNFKNSTGTVIIDASGKGTIHLINKDGLFSNIPIYNITLNNHIGGVLETTFAYRQSSDANITIGIAPTVNGIKFKKIGDDKLQVELDVSDDKDILDLSYSWSFNGNGNINIENNAINPIIINNFNDSIEGTLITIVTDKHNLTYTHEYNITANQFKADDIFKVSSTSVDDNKIFANESIDILFNKEIRVDEINTNSININDGIKSVPGSFTFPSTNKKKVVFTPSTPWKTTKSYNLNITAKVLDSDGHKLIPVVVEFEALNIQPCSLVTHDGYEFSGTLENGESQTKYKIKSISNGNIRYSRIVSCNMGNKSYANEIVDIVSCSTGYLANGTSCVVRPIQQYNTFEGEDYLMGGAWTDPRPLWCEREGLLFHSSSGTMSRNDSIDVFEMYTVTSYWHNKGGGLHCGYGKHDCYTWVKCK